jgi:polyprenyldihydroxybenzoate methyltransferase / 3-demethylubiquinol 3-O-methyltransferase
VSPTEISHFSRLAASWWDPYGPSRLLHLMNPLRHTFINSCLSSVITSPTRKGLNYLDIGCGGGIFAESAARLLQTHTVTAIDPTPSVLAVAKEHQRTDPALSLPKLNYLNTAIEDLPIPTSDEEKADILTLFEVLEHIDHPSAFLQSCIPHLKSGGWIIGSTISRSPLSFLTTKLIAEAPIIGVVPRGTHDWTKYINPGELSDWFDKRSMNAKVEERWGDLKTQGVIYVPGLGWKMMPWTEGLGNYFFAVQRLVDRAIH